MKEIDHLKLLLSSKFEIKELGEAKRILGMDIIRDMSKGHVYNSTGLYQKGFVEVWNE